MPAGRPSSFNQKIADEICERIANAEALTKICQDEHMPSTPTVFRWARQNEEFRSNLARAREDMADFISHQIIQIADEQQDDWFEGKYGPVFNKEAAARSRIRIDARIKLMQMLKPKSYSERIEHSGPDGGPIQIVSTIPRPPKE